MRVKLTKSSVVKGSVWPAGTVLEVGDEQGQTLIGLKRAERVEDTIPAADSGLTFQIDVTSDKGKKSKGD